MKANILVTGQIVLPKLCLKSNLEYTKHPYIRDFGEVFKQTFPQTHSLVDYVTNWAALC